MSRSNTIISEENERMGKGLGKCCSRCGLEIKNVPYLSHLPGARRHIHYYHIECAKIVHLL